MKTIKCALVGISWAVVGYCSQYLGATTFLVAVLATLTTAIVFAGE